MRCRTATLLFVIFVAYSLVRAQTIFNCSSGFATSGTCGVAIGYPPNQNFYVSGAFNGSTPIISGTAMELVPTGSSHTALSLTYTSAEVNVQAFQAIYTFVPDGQNIVFNLQANTNSNSGQNGVGATTTGGAGCEAGIYQSAGPSQPTSPNNTFGIELDSYGALTDGNSSGAGGGTSSFTYSNTQIYQQNQDPCSPRNGPEWYYYFTKKVSTSPVPLNSPVGSENTTTGDTYSVTITYTGSNVTEQLYDVTAGGSCPGSSCFTYTWNNVSVPSLVGATTAWVQLAEGSYAGNLNPSPLFIKTFSYTVLSAASTPTFSPSSGTYGSTQSVTISDSSSGSIICYNTTGNPSTNGIGGCANSTLYSGAISVAKGETLYAVAGSGTSPYGDSAVGSASYNITGYAAAPTFSASGGIYNGNQTVILTAAHGGVICYNTIGSPATNGSTGCTTGTLYSSPVVVSSNETLYAVTGGTGFTDSGVASVAYTISPYWGTYGDSPLPPATPTFSPLPGSYSGSQSVTLASTTSGAYICYELSSTPLVVQPYVDSTAACAAQASWTGSSISGNTLTLGTLNFGAVAIGQVVSGVGVIPATITGGSGTSWTINGPSQSVSSEQMYFNAQGNLYTGPVTVSSSQYLYAIAGVPNTQYTYCASGTPTCQSSSAPSSMAVAQYTIGSATGQSLTTGRYISPGVSKQ